MAQAQSESSHYNEYDYLVINDDFETALTQIETIVLAKRLSLQCQAVKHQRLIADLIK